MTRPLRIELSGGIYHVTSRGNRHDDIYFSDDDRKVCKKWGQVFHYHIVML